MAQFRSLLCDLCGPPRPLCLNTDFNPENAEGRRDQRPVKVLASRRPCFSWLYRACLFLKPCGPLCVFVVAASNAEAAVQETLSVCSCATSSLQQQRCHSRSNCSP